MRLFFALLFTLGLSLTSCFSGHENMLPNAVGAEGELLLVIDDDMWREHPMGDTLRDILQQPFPGLPQVEPLFRLSRVQEVDFSGSIRRHQSVFMALVGPEHRSPKPTIQYGHDPFAQGQFVVRLSANHPNEWLAAFNKMKGPIIDSFRTIDLHRKMARLKAAPAQTAIDSIKAYQGLQIDLPQGYQAMVLGKSKSVVHYEAERVEKGKQLFLSKSVLLAKRPYPGPQVFAYDSLLQFIDGITSQTFFGENEGSYLVTEIREAPELKYLDWHGNYAMEVRGLWRMSNEFKGGPFLAYAVVNETTQSLYLFHGHAYGPGLDKRVHMLELEAILRSIRF